MEEPYGLTDLRHFNVPRDTHFPASAPPMPPPLAGVAQPPFSFADEGCCGGGGAQGRWPRQETLTLLEVRTLLDWKFREASQKASLWDEVSRILREEHGYQRSGRKCKEKLENLYKYYKRTKERKVGKHYRFFKQLEALYGSQNTNNKEAPLQAQNFQKVLYDSLINSSSSSESDIDEDEERGKIKELIEMQIRRLMEVQEAWLNKAMGALERVEQERISRDDAWRRDEAARWDRERCLRARERAWTEARDAALIEALDNISRRDSSSHPLESSPSLDASNDDDGKDNDDEIINELKKFGGGVPNYYDEIVSDLGVRNGSEPSSICNGDLSDAVKQASGYGLLAYSQAL